MVGIIIQARMGSSRLPGKILKDFAGKSLLEHIMSRLERLQYSAQVVIATSNDKKDDIVELFCKKNDFLCFRGSEDNVLERYYECAKKYGFHHIVRMTGDNPFPDIEELNRLIEYHIDKKNDFSENFSVLPIGVGMEIMSYNALQESLKKADLPKYFEHADEYILDHLEAFSHGILEVKKEKNRPEIRLTVDTDDDYKKACFIIEKAGKDYITTEEAIELEQKYQYKYNQ